MGTAGRTAVASAAARRDPVLHWQLEESLKPEGGAAGEQPDVATMIRMAV